MSEQIGNISEKLADLLSECTDENRHESVWDEPTTEIVKVKRLHPDAVIPTKAHEHDAGFDLVAVEDVIIEPGETALIKTGIAVELPEGFELQVRQRSGITLNTKLRVQLGTVDSTYRGEVGVIVDNIAQDMFSDFEYSPFNLTKDDVVKGVGHFPYETYAIRKGDRIAQSVIQRLPSVQITEVEALGESDRGEGGFGSTGVTNTRG